MTPPKLETVACTFTLMTLEKAHHKICDWFVANTLSRNSELN